MAAITLSADVRPLKPSARAVRRRGMVPCVLYGYETKNTLLSCKEFALQKAWTAAGQSTLVELDIGTRKIPVLFYDITHDPVTDRIAHADFYAVNMKEEVEAEVPIRFTDSAPATKETGVILVTPLTHVTVRALPAHLPHELTVSLSAIAKIHDTLHVRDIPLSKGVTIIDDADSVIALAQEQRIELEPEPTIPAEGAESAVPAEGAPAAEQGSPQGTKEGMETAAAGETGKGKTKKEK